MKEDTKAAVNNDELDPGTAPNPENENQAAANTENASQEPDKGKKAKKTEEVKKPEEPKSTNIYKEETYDITLPITRGEDDEVTVLINGECTKIQRGVQVTVSAAVYEVLQNTMKMDNLAYMRSKQLAELKKLN